MDVTPPEAPRRMTYAELVDALKRSQSWHARIARESGCKRHILRMMANREGYYPKVDQVEMIERWFLENGVPTIHIHAARAAARRTL